MRVTNILLTGASSLGALAQVPDHLNKRAACNRDNLFRCFIDQRYSSQASDFCAELAPFTATVATSIATVTSTVESTITADAAKVTQIYKTTIFTETVPTATAVVTADTSGAVKRQVAANPPKCMTNGVTYPASRMTSACSCISVPASTVSVTHVVSTETITEINTITTTPRATVTSWETVFTATTGGTSTITVLPTQVNRLINGDFETGDSTGWKLSPESWKGDFYKLGGRQNQWTYLVYDAAGELGILRQVKPIYLEAGSYLTGLHAPPAKFPHNSDYWQKVVRYELVNHATETTISPKFGSSKVMVAAGAIVVPLQVGFDVPEEAEGYYDVALRFLERPPEGQPKSTYCRIDNLYLQKL